MNKYLTVAGYATAMLGLTFVAIRIGSLITAVASPLCLVGLVILFILLLAKE